MGLAQTLLNDLADKYGMYSSWAVWNPDKAADTGIIAEHISCLKTSVVMIGLNVSRDPGGCWRNFHGNDHARKLMKAFNDSPYRGAYMTDLIKEVDKSAGSVSTRIKAGDIILKKHIDKFCEEMRHVGAGEHSLFILFGNEVFKHFKKHLASLYPNHVKCAHYSSRGTDAEWVENSLKRLEEHCGRGEGDESRLARG